MQKPLARISHKASFKTDGPLPPGSYASQVADEIRSITKGQGVFTLDAMPQFSGLESIPGFEMDIFSVVPDADEQACRTYHINNRKQVLDAITRPCADEKEVRLRKEESNGNQHLTNKQKVT